MWVTCGTTTFKRAACISVVVGSEEVARQGLAASLLLFPSVPQQQARPAHWRPIPRIFNLVSNLPLRVQPLPVQVHVWTPKPVERTVTTTMASIANVG